MFIRPIWDALDSNGLGGLRNRCFHAYRNAHGLHLGPCTFSSGQGFDMRLADVHESVCYHCMSTSPLATALHCYGVMVCSVADARHRFEAASGFAELEAEVSLRDALERSRDRAASPHTVAQARLVDDALVYAISDLASSCERELAALEGVWTATGALAQTAALGFAASVEAVGLFKGTTGMGRSEAELLRAWQELKAKGVAPARISKRLGQIASGGALDPRSASVAATDLARRLQARFHQNVTSTSQVLFATESALADVSVRALIGPFVITVKGGALVAAPVVVAEALACLRVRLGPLTDLGPLDTPDVLETAAALWEPGGHLASPAAALASARGLV